MASGATFSDANLATEVPWASAEAVPALKANGMKPAPAKN
jgi:hypothetical protein